VSKYADLCNEQVRSPLLGCWHCPAYWLAAHGRAQVVLGNSYRLQLPRHISGTFCRIDILPAVRCIVVSQAAVRSVAISARPFGMLLAAPAVGAYHENDWRS